MDPGELKDLWLFANLSKDELAKVARWSEEVTIGAGHELASEGRFAHEFFVVADGTAAVMQGDEQIAELGRGDFFGEIGLLETQRRTASVIARTPMRLIVMFEREFAQMTHELPAIADRIRAAIRARLHG